MPTRTTPGALPAPQSRPASSIGTLFRRDDRDLYQKYGSLLAPYFRLDISDPNENILFSGVTTGGAGLTEYSLANQASPGGYDLNGLVVSEVVWDETDCQCDELRFVVNNVDMTLHDSPLFAEGNNVDLWMGYDGHQPEYMGRAIIVEREPVFQNNPATIDIRCYDISHFLMEEGRAEIQEEGSEWWDMQRVQVEQPTEEQTTEFVDNAIADNQNELETRQRTAQSLGVNPQSIPTTTISDIGPDINPAQTPVNILRTDPQQSVMPPPRPPAYRNVLRKTNPGKRRQRKSDGKVWRGKTDSEIAASIFNSYGILPYTEATSESRRQWVTRTVREGATAQQQEYLDRGRLSDNAQEEQLERENARRFGAEDIVPAGNVSDDADSHDLSREPVFVQTVTEGQEPTERTERVQVDRRMVQKKGTSDWDFIKKLAAVHHYIVFVFFHYESRTWIGYFGPQEKVPQWVIYQLAYAQGEATSLQSVKPRISMRSQSTEIELIYIDPVLRKENRLRVEISNLSRFTRSLSGDSRAMRRAEQPIGNGPEVVLNVHGQRIRTVADRRFTSAEDAQEWLTSFWYRYAEEFCEAGADCLIGLPELHARSRHVLSGFGKASGEYFLTKVTHTMRESEGYTTRISGFRIPENITAETSNTTVQQTMGEATLPAERSELEYRKILLNARNRVSARWRRDTEDFIRERNERLEE